MDDLSFVKLMAGFALFCAIVMLVAKDNDAKTIDSSSLFCDIVMLSNIVGANEEAFRFSIHVCEMVTFPGPSYADKSIPESTGPRFSNLNTGALFRAGKLIFAIAVNELAMKAVPIVSRSFDMRPVSVGALDAMYDSVIALTPKMPS